MKNALITNVEKFNTSISIIFTMFLIFLMGNTTITQFYLLTGGRKFGVLSDERFIVILFFILFVSLLVNKKNFSINDNKLSIVLFLVMCFSMSYLSFINVTGGFEKLKTVVFSYYWLSLILFLMIFNIDYLQEKYIKVTLILGILIQSLFGIIQYITNKPLVFTSYNGNPVLNTIYYLDGVSSASDILHNMGAQVRAFGFTDSGLTLGLLSLVLFCAIFYQLLESEKNKEKYILSAILIVTSLSIAMTITRNVYLVGSLTIILLFFLRNTSKIKITMTKAIYIFTLIINVFFLFFSRKMLETLQTDVNFLQTIYSRQIGYQKVLDELQFDIAHILFGSGIVPSRDLFIDNDFIYIYANLGLIIYVLIQTTYIYILFKALEGIKSNKYSSPFLKGLVVFMISYPFAGWINSVVNIYFPIAVIVYLLMIGEERDLRKRKIRDEV